MASNHAQVLGQMLQHLVGVNHAVTALKHNMAGLRPVVVGALGAFVGFRALEGMWHMVRAGNKLNEELSKTAMLGGEFATKLEQIKRAAFDVHFKVPNVAPSEAVHIMREIGPQMQTPEDAIKLGVPMAQMATVLNYFTGKGHDMGGSDALRDVVRTVEMRRRLYKHDPATGQEVVDIEAFQRESTAMERGIILSQGMLKPRDFLLMARQAGPAGMMQDPTTFYALMGELSVAMGSQRAGTALTSLFQQFGGGTMTQRVAREMTRMGILQPGEWHPQHGGGGGVLVEPEATKRLAAAIQNPFEYIQKTLVPQLEAHGKKGMDLLTEVFLLFGRATTQRFVSEIAMGGPQWARTLKMFPEVMDPQTAQKYLHQNSLDFSLGELTSSWQGLMEVLSEQNINPFIMGVHGLTDAINWLAHAAIAHPTLSHWLVNASIGIAGFAAVMGTLAVVRFLVLNSGLRGLVMSLVTMQGLRLLTIASGLGALGVGIELLGDKLDKIPKWLIHGASGAAFGAMLGSRFGFWGALLGGGAGAVAGAVIGTPEQGTPQQSPMERGAGAAGGAMSPQGPSWWERLFGGGRHGQDGQRGQDERAVERYIRAHPDYIPPAGFPGRTEYMRRRDRFLHSQRPPESWGDWLWRHLPSRGGSGGGEGGEFGNPWEGPQLPGTGQRGGDPGSALAVATQHMGERGSQVNAFLHTNGQRINAAMSAWCAAFVNASLRAVGIEGSGSAVATSFERWGRAVQAGDLRPGDVMVEPRGHRPGEIGGHVGFATGRSRMHNGREEFEMVSGNMGHQVSRTWEDARGIDVRRSGQDTTTINLHIDGHQITRVVLNRAGRMLSGAGSGTTGVSPRLVPDNPGGWS